MEGAARTPAVPSALALAVSAPAPVVVVGETGQRLPAGAGSAERAVRRRRPVLRVRELVAECLGAPEAECACVWNVRSGVLRLALQCWARRSHVAREPLDADGGERDAAPLASRIAGRRIAGAAALVCVDTDGLGQARGLRPLAWTDVQELGARGEAPERAAQALMLRLTVQGLVSGAGGAGIAQPRQFFVPSNAETA